MILNYKLPLAAFAAIFSLSVYMVVSEREEQKDMDKSNQSVVGRWQKTVQSDCKVLYPSEVEFLKQGFYFAPEAVNEGAVWHGGDWQLLSENRLSIQSANDAMLNYRISIHTSNSLILVDEEGCHISYGKI